MLTTDNLKAARTNLKESQAEFGRRFGVDQSTVHRWETEGVPNRGPARVAIERVLAEIAPPTAPETEEDHPERQAS